MSFAPDSLRAADMLISPVWSILGKGQTGTGKTIFFTGKEFRPCYTFDMEGRFESVIRYYKKLDGHCNDVYYNHFPLRDGFFKVRQKMDDILRHPEYKSIHIASLTSFIRNVLRQLKMDSPEWKDASGRTRGVRKKGGFQANILEDFNFEDAALMDDLIGFLMDCKSMGMNTFLEAHITPYEVKTINEETGDKDLQTIFEILTKGRKAPAELPGYFNEVWLFEKHVGQSWNDPTRYRINTDGTATSSCKSSFGIKSFDWTDVDGSELIVSQLSDEVKMNPRVDPNKPAVVKW